MSVMHRAFAPDGTWRASSSIRPSILLADASHLSNPTLPAGSCFTSLEQAVPHASLITDRHNMRLLFAKARDVTSRTRQSEPAVRGILSELSGRSLPLWGSAHQESEVGQTNLSEGCTHSTGTPWRVSSRKVSALQSFARSTSVSHSSRLPYPRNRQSFISKE